MSLPMIVAIAALTLSAAACARPPASAPDGIEVTEIARGLEHPWSLAFLPDGRMLVTERPGRMRLVSAGGEMSAPLREVPAVAARGQGGLLDLALMPDFTRSRQLVFCYAEPRDHDTNGTAIARAVLDDTALRNVEVIFRQQPAMDSGHHFGCRLAFAPDGTLFATLGERNKGRELAQSRDNHLGKVIRIGADGSIPRDNPDADGRAGAAAVWSYGHRNPQGAAIHPQTGRLWIHEHGPKGGDEINIPVAGGNYGWPVVTAGREYSGLAVGDGRSSAPGMVPAIHTWVPSIAPSGMAFYTADRFPAWRGQLFVGSLKFGQLVRLQLDGDRVVQEQRLLDGLKQRIRDVRQGPDGYLYLLTDGTDGRILRVGLAPDGR